jgi:hypothetical protein
MYKIYKIIIPDSKYIYYDITTQLLSQKLYYYKKYYKKGNYLRTNLRFVLNENNIDDIKIILIKSFIIKEDAELELKNILNSKELNILNNINMDNIKYLKKLENKIIRLDKLR